MATVHPGLKNIVITRLISVGLWHVCIQTLLLQLLVSVDFSEEPLLWLTTWIRNLFKPKFFAVAFFQSVLSTLFVFTESSQYLKVNSCDRISRIRYICQKLSPVSLLWFIVYFLRAILSVIVFCTALESYFTRLAAESNSKNVDDRVTQLRILLITNSMWINALFYLNNFLYQRSFKYFSLVQRHYSQIVPSILAAIKDASLRSVYYCSVFVAFYLLIGSSLCSLVCYYLFSVTGIIPYSSILSPSVFYRLWLFNAFFLFNNCILKLLLDILLTSRLEFPIVGDTSSKQDTPITLKDAMATNNVPVLRYLGYYDLNIVSQFDSNRRRQIFTLSYPGGHPYTWREISKEAILLINDTADQLNSITTTKPTPVESRKFPPAERYYSNIRPLSPPRVYDRTSLIEEKQREDDVIKKISGYLKSIRSVAYLVEDMTEKRMEATLEHFQAISLACYSLANLATASKTEDKFGIVQQDLSTIIHALLRLYVALNKLGAAVNKRPNASILQVKKSLSSVAKSSLYQISIHFGKYAKDLSLSVEDEKLFESFIHFKN